MVSCLASSGLIAGLFNGMQDVMAAKTVEATSATFTDGNNQQASDEAAKLKGNVQFNVLHAEADLNSLKGASKKLKKTALVYMSELQRVNEVSVGAPNVVGSTIINAVPSPTGMMALGKLPPRQHMLMAMLYEISKVVKQIHDTQQALREPLSRNAEIIDDWYLVTAIKRDIVQHYNTLKELTEQEQINEPALNREILAIYNDADKIQQPLNKVLAVIAVTRKATGETGK